MMLLDNFVAFAASASIAPVLWGCGRAAAAYRSRTLSTIIDRMVSKKLSSAHEEHASLLLTASMLCLFSVSTFCAGLKLFAFCVADTLGLGNVQLCGP